MEPDKRLHLIAGLLITLVWSIWVDPFKAMLASVAIGLLKEVIDYIVMWVDRLEGRKQRTHPDPYDFAYTGVGSVLGYPLALWIFGG